MSELNILFSTYTLKYYSIDKFSNKEPEKTKSFSIVQAPPTATGKISGYVYEDANSNGIKDTTEKNLSGWKIHIQKTGMILPNTCKQTEREEDDDEEGQKQNNKCYRYTIVSNNLGYYELPNLYSGTYTIQEMVKENWSITSPTKTTTNPNQVYTLTLTNGQQVTGKNFGNKKMKKN